MKLLRRLWAMLPYPITHLHECLNTSDEFHAFVKGLCLPACRIWRLKSIVYAIEEQHYFMAGVLLSTIGMVASIAAIIKWLT